jgi:hypothetical protein
MSSSVMLAPSQERKPRTAPTSKCDSVHRRVSRGPDIRAAGNLSVQRLSLQRCGGHKCPPSGCSPEGKRRLEGHSHEDQFGGIPAAVIDVLRSAGHPLDGRTKSVMESVFGLDLRDIRIHSDAAAAASADAMGALAYTVGSDVVLGRGYTDHSVAGAEVLAHELAHALQQRRGPSRGASLVIEDNPVLEAEADQWAGRAKKAVSHMPHSRAAPTIAGVAGRSAEHRCTRGQTCSAEDLVDHQGHGTTTCDRASGRMNVIVTEHCAGNCVAQHESVHVGDRQDCCTRVSTCLTNAAGDPAREAACHAAYSTWHPQLSDWTECRAYTTEVGCLTSFIAANCNGRQRATTGAVIGGLLGAVAGGIGGFLLGGPIGAVAGAAVGGGLGAAAGYTLGSVSEGCCNTLRSELAFAQGEVASRCPGVNQPCPFRADGTII